jgi:hypothetical protein
MKETFDLPVQDYVLVACMQRIGRKYEAGGGISETSMELDADSRIWSVKATPEVTKEGDTTILTWMCGSVPFVDFDVRPVLDTQCFQWRIKPVFLGVRIDATCEHLLLKQTFYKLIVDAEDATPLAQEEEDKRLAELERDWWAAVADEPEPTQQKKKQPDKPAGGPKQMKCNREALQRLRDGQSRKANFYQWKQEYTKEKGIDPDHTKSGASDLHRKNIWEKYQAEITQNSTG